MSLYLVLTYSALVVLSVTRRKKGLSYSSLCSPKHQAYALYLICLKTFWWIKNNFIDEIEFVISIIASGLNAYF